MQIKVSMRYYLTLIILVYFFKKKRNKEAGRRDSTAEWGACLALGQPRFIPRMSYRPPEALGVITDHRAKEKSWELLDVAPPPKC